MGDGGDSGLLFCHLSVASWGVCSLSATRNGDSLEGVITIHSKSYLANMRRVPPGPPATAPAAAWAPANPIPYTEEPVEFASGPFVISGSLTVPAGADPHPAIVLLGGSVPTDRDGNAFEGQGVTFYRQIADYLSRRGFVVLRADDRGVGKSTGERNTATLADLADDGVAAVQYLRSRREVRPGQIGLIGQSEGALVAPIVCARTPRASFAVLLAPEAVPGDVAELEYLRRLLARRDLPGRDRYERQLERRARMFPLLLAGERPAEVERQLLEAGGSDEDEVKRDVKRFATGRTAYALRYDPGPVLAQTTVPVLAVYFGHDEVIPSDLNEPPLRQAFARGGNDQLTVKHFADLGHGLEPVPEENKERPGSAWSPSEDVLRFVSHWLAEHTATGTKRAE